jgi:uncharacterized LabA/DUF88 family protein
MSEGIENLLFMQRGQEQPQENVALFIDHENLFLSGRKYGISNGYDFDKLIKLSKKYGRLVLAYVFGAEGNKQYEFFRLGVEPKFTPYDSHKSLADPMMICEILCTLYERPDINVFIIATSDKDFIPVLLHLSKNKDRKNVIVVGFAETAGTLIIDVCTNLNFNFLEYKNICKIIT